MTFRLNPVREGELRDFAGRYSPEFLRVFSELEALRAELAEARWRAAETEKTNDALAAENRRLRSVIEALTP